MIGKLFRAGLAGLVIAFTVWGADASRAANVTPDQLTSDTSPQNTDLLVIWPTGGPLKSLQWSLLVSQVGTSLGGTFLTKSLNLSDVPSPSTARNNLGLGTAATQNTGTSGANLPFLNGANTWSGVQTYTNSDICLLGSSTGCTTFTSANAGASNFTVTIPAATDTVDLISTAQTLTNKSISGSEINSGTIGANQGGAGTISGALKGNGSGVVSQAACADLSNGNTGCSEAVGTGAGTLAAGNDSRFAGPTQNVQCGSPYTLVIGDAGGQIYCNTAGAHTTAIPANSSVAFAIGIKVDIINDCSAGAMTVSITTDTLVFLPSGSTGSRTLAACGEATATKVNTSRWVIVGAGLS